MEKLYREDRVRCGARAEESNNADPELFSATIFYEIFVASAFRLRSRRNSAESY